MTVKQLTTEIERHKKELKRVKKNHEEMLAERGFSNWENEIAYEEKMVKKYIDMLPEVKAAEELKMMKKLEKQQIANKASTIGYIKDGCDIKGITPNGKKWYGTLNWSGHTERTLHCYTLRIDGEVIFTSGLLENVLKTVAQN